MLVGSKFATTNPRSEVNVWNSEKRTLSTSSSFVVIDRDFLRSFLRSGPAEPSRLPRCVLAQSQRGSRRYLRIQSLLRHHEIEKRRSLILGLLRRGRARAKARILVVTGYDLSALGLGPELVEVQEVGRFSADRGCPLQLLGIGVTSDRPTVATPFRNLEATNDTSLRVLACSYLAGHRKRSSCRQ